MFQLCQDVVCAAICLILSKHCGIRVVGVLDAAKTAQKSRKVRDLCIAIPCVRVECGLLVRWMACLVYGTRGGLRSVGSLRFHDKN